MLLHLIVLNDNYEQIWVPQNVTGVVEFVFNSLHEPIHTLFGVSGVLV